MKTLLIFVLCLESGSGVNVIGCAGGNVEIRCPYAEGYEGRSKYLCRGSCPASWIFHNKDIPVQTLQGQTQAIHGRFTLDDDTTARVFTVTITGLTAKDSGRYWCAVKTGFGAGDEYTEMQLEVVQPVTEHSTTESVTPERGTFNPSGLAGLIVGLLLILMTVGGLTLLYLRKTHKDTQTLDHLPTSTETFAKSSRCVAGAGTHSPVSAPQPALDPSTTSAARPPQTDPEPQALKPDRATPNSLYEMMSAVPLSKARAARAATSSSVRSVDNEYIVMGTRPPGVALWP